jgi:two-component system, NtrC family, response regulator AtoC
MGNHRNVLVVDPDSSIRALLVALLRREGFDADAADNAEEALDLRQRSQHATVVLEPRIRGGEELLDALAADGKPNVIIMTAMDGSKPAYPGARAVLFKPFLLEEMAAVLASCRDGG